MRSSASIASAQRAHLGERMRAHPQQQRLVRLAGAVDADVRLRRRRQQPAQRVERLGANRRAIHAVRIRRRLRDSARSNQRAHRRDPPRVVSNAASSVATYRSRSAPVELGGHEVAPAAVRVVGVRDVARGLLEVRHQAAALEHLGQDVRRVLARHVHAAELRDRVVAVLVEHPLVQPLGARSLPTSARRRRPRGRATSSEELVEEQPPQRLRRPRVAREQRALDRLRQVDSAKTGESRFVKYGASRRRSTSVNCSADAALGSTRGILPLNPARDAWMAGQDVEMQLNPGTIQRCCCSPLTIRHPGRAPRATTHTSWTAP